MGRLVIAAGEACVLSLTPFLDRDWRSVRSRDSQWSVWDTMVHVNDVLYFYAAQILLADESDYICFELSADDHSNAGRLLAALTAHARMLAAAVAFADPNARGHHVYGVSDPDGFTAMGVLESLVHTYDAVQGMDSTSTWNPPDDLAVPVLARLFPDTPTDISGDPGRVLLYMCGRMPLGHLPRREDWRWYGAVPTTSRAEPI